MFDVCWEEEEMGWWVGLDGLGLKFWILFFFGIRHRAFGVIALGYQELINCTKRYLNTRQ